MSTSTPNKLSLWQQHPKIMKDQQLFNDQIFEKGKIDAKVH